MICRSCGGLYFRNNTQKICLSCYTNDGRRERLFYTVKEWKKFKYNIQTELLAQYEVILTDHKTIREKLMGFFKRSSPELRQQRKEKIGKGFKTFKKFMDSFSKGMNQIHFEGGAGDAGFNKISGGLNKATGTDHNFNVLTGGNPGTWKKKRKNNWKYVKVRRESKGSKGNNERDYSALTG